MEYCEDCKYLLEDGKCAYWGEDAHGTTQCAEKTNVKDSYSLRGEPHEVN